MHAGISPSGKQTPAYGQRAAGTHPTGMHSCFYQCLVLKLEIRGKESLEYGRMHTRLCIETRYIGVTPLGYIWGFHKCTKLAILALLPTLYSHMSHFAYACKMRYPLNLVLENIEYL